VLSSSSSSSSLSTTYSDLKQVRILFQNEFSKDCFIVLPLSTSGISSFLKVLPVSAYLFYLHFLSLIFSFYLSLNNVDWKAVPTQD
jgi:hypothetical protein